MNNVAKVRSRATKVESTPAPESGVFLAKPASVNITDEIHVARGVLRAIFCAVAGVTVDDSGKGIEDQFVDGLQTLVDRAESRLNRLAELTPEPSPLECVAVELDAVVRLLQGFDACVRGLERDLEDVDAEGLREMSGEAQELLSALARRVRA